MEKLIFEPLDTLFFRDGRPFNQGEGNGGVESLFPPSPTTLVGAARVALARQLGWPGRGKWIDTIQTDLGGDDDQLEGLRFSGPLLEKDGETLFPVPASLAGVLNEENQPASMARLEPGDPLHCDMGEHVRIPTLAVPADDKTEGRKPLSGWWLTRCGLQKVLEGGVPSARDLIHPSQLWVSEAKVGNAIDGESGTVIEGMLYSTRHIRMHAGVRLVLWIGAGAELRNQLPQSPQRIQVPLGGEARSCWLTRKAEPLDLADPSLSTANGSICYAVHVLTPLNPEHPPAPGKPFEKLPGKLVSACLPRPQLWGGWDSTRFEPLPMRPHLPPGSVLFMEAGASEEQRIIELHGTAVGQRSSWGFGLIAIGKWNQRRDK